MNDRPKCLRDNEYNWIAGGDNPAETATLYCRCGRCGSKLHVGEMGLTDESEWFLYCSECKVPIGKVIRKNDDKKGSNA